LSLVDLLALKLIDTGLQLVNTRGRLSRPSPGLALIDGREIAVGVDAECNARIKPRRLHSRFWQDLGIASLTRPFPSYLRTADLAHAHLKAVWEADGGGAREVIAAVPGTYSDDQLALFLGIARDLAIPVRGLVDAAVAAAVDRELSTSALHLDLHLHRVVLTVLEHGDELVRKAVHTENRVGLLGLRDIWARVIAQAFVRVTRFDPLHVASTEQVLYAQLADHLEALAEKESTEVRIASGGRQHAVELDRALIVGAADALYERLSALAGECAPSDDTSLLLSHRAATLPGLVNYLEEGTGLKVVVLHPAAAASGALAHADLIRSMGPEMPFVTRLPGLDARPPAPVTVPVTPPAKGGRHLPTHLVVDGVAHQIASEPLILGPDGVEDGSEATHASVSVRHLAGQAVLEAAAGVGMILNGDPLEGRTALAPGDRMRFGEAGPEILVVSMAE
jgi:hypothetical protein